MPIEKTFSLNIMLTDKEAAITIRSDGFDQDLTCDSPGSVLLKMFEIMNGFETVMQDSEDEGPEHEEEEPEADPEEENGVIIKDDDEPELVDMAEIQELTSLSLSTITSRLYNGKFPAHTHESGKKHLWEKAIVQKWLIDYLDEKERKDAKKSEKKIFAETEGEPEELSFN